MKDKLNRDIMAGDTLAFAAMEAHSYAVLKLAKVVATSPFAVQVEDIDDAKDKRVWVATSSDHFIICDWGKGSDAAK